MTLGPPINRQPTPQQTPKEADADERNWVKHNEHMQRNVVTGHLRTKLPEPQPQWWPNMPPRP